MMTVALFKDRKTGKYELEIGSGGGLDKRSDSERELVQLTGCNDHAHVKMVIASIKRKYQISFTKVEN